MDFFLSLASSDFFFQCSAKRSKSFLFHSSVFYKLFHFQKLSASSDSSDEHCEKSSSVLYSVQMSTASTVYESCYSRSSCLDDEFLSATSSPLSSSNSTTYVLLIPSVYYLYFFISKYERINCSLESNPILFASFNGSVETVIIRVRNNEISSHYSLSSEKVFLLFFFVILYLISIHFCFSGTIPFFFLFFQEINLNFDGLCVFLTPSQLNILKKFFAAIAKPPNSGLFKLLRSILYSYLYFGDFLSSEVYRMCFRWHTMRFRETNVYARLSAG